MKFRAFLTFFTFVKLRKNYLSRRGSAVQILFGLLQYWMNVVMLMLSLKLVLCLNTAAT